MIHPTRTNLLLLKERALAVANSIGIIKARKQALIQEFLAATRPFLRSREDIRTMYGSALMELAMSLGHEGRNNIESITASTARDFGVDITQKSIWGLVYKDILAHHEFVREPDMRGYDYRSTTPHVEEGIYLFEKILEAMMEMAGFECKLKRLGDEIIRMTRRIRVLEERVLPNLRLGIKTIAQYIGEREREAYYRQKRAKTRLSER